MNKIVLTFAIILVAGCEMRQNYGYELFPRDLEQPEDFNQDARKPVLWVMEGSTYLLNIHQTDGSETFRLRFNIPMKEADKGTLQNLEQYNENFLFFSLQLDTSCSYRVEYFATVGLSLNNYANPGHPEIYNYGTPSTAPGKSAILYVTPCDDERGEMAVSVYGDQNELLGRHEFGTLLVETDSYVVLPF